MAQINNLPVVVFMASSDCAVCRNIRGVDGLIKENNEVHSSNVPLIAKKYYWNQDFFVKLLKCGNLANLTSKVRIYDIYLNKRYSQNLDDALKQGLTLSEITFENQKAVKTIYTKFDNNIIIKTVCVGNNKNTSRINKNFEEFVKSLIPNSIGNWWYIFPNWLFANGDEWNQSIANETPINMYASSCIRGLKSPGVYGSVGYDIETIKLRGLEDPIENAKKLISGTLIEKEIVPSALLKSLNIPEPQVQSSFKSFQSRPAFNGLETSSSAPTHNASNFKIVPGNCDTN